MQDSRKRYYCQTDSALLFLRVVEATSSRKRGQARVQRGASDHRQPQTTSARQNPLRSSPPHPPYMSKHGQKRGRPSLGQPSPPSKRPNTSSSSTSTSETAPRSTAGTSRYSAPSRDAQENDDHDFPGPVTVSVLRELVDVGGQL